MGKFIKLFETDPARVEYEGSESYLEPYVSYVDGDNTVHYNKPKETRVVAVFDVTSTSSSTPIGSYQYISAFTEIEIDGVVQPTVVSAYTFDTVGEHTVKYTLADPTSIGTHIFRSCRSLTSITIPDSVVSIGAEAFEYCNFTSVTIPSKVTSIGDYAFSYCSGLTEATIPNSVTSIGDNAFQGCYSLTSVTIPDSVTSINKRTFQNCTNLTNVTIPNSVTSIGENAFYYCSSLTSVTIGSGVASIGNYAFQECRGLTSVTIPDNVTSIGYGVFQNCSGLTSVTIGNGITSIGASAFGYCTSLNTITSHIMAAPSVYGGTFAGVGNGGTLYVPTGSSGYETWMNDQGNLGSCGWTKVEQ